MAASTYLIRYWYSNIRGGKDEGELTQALIEDWYDLADPGSFTQRYPLAEGINISTKQPEKVHYEWIKNTSISRTPTFFVMGYELPDTYAIKDLTAIIPGLVPLFETQEFKTKELAG